MTTEKTKQQLAQEERDKITVQSLTPEKTAEEIKADEEAAKLKADEDAAAKDKADKEAADKAKADTEAAEKAKLEAEGGKKGEVEDDNIKDEKDPEKLAKIIERLQKRVDKLTAKNTLTEKEKTELAAKLQQIETAEGKTFTEADVEKISDEKADKKLADRLFVDACNKLADGATKLDKDFPKKVNAMTEEFAPIPGQMIGILEDFDNGSAVLNYLANNVDEYGDIHTLVPGKMGAKLKEISIKLAKEAEEKGKKPAKEISKVPEAKEPIGGSAKVDNILRDDEPIEDWMTKRNRQAAERAAAKRASMR